MPIEWTSAASEVGNRYSTSGWVRPRPAREGGAGPGGRHLHVPVGAVEVGEHEGDLEVGEAQAEAAAGLAGAVVEVHEPLLGEHLEEGTELRAEGTVHRGGR